MWHAAGVCQGQSSNPTRRKSRCGPGLGKFSEIWGFPFNITATAEASDFKFGTQLGFAKAHLKITPRRKSEGVFRLGSSPKFCGSPVIFLQRLGLATSNLAHSWGLPRPIIKSQGWAWPWARGAPQNLGVALQYLHNG